MIDKEPLSSVSKYQPGAELARPGSPLVFLAPSEAASVEKANAAQAAETRAIDSKALEKALGNLSTHIQNLQRSLHFSVDKESGETVVRVVDTETNEVIRQIPSEELLNIAAGLRTAGMLLSDHA